ncbi:MAG TPA: wax ester/triacylglycerol synthase domain-containing protein, partial [Terriglobales bacterium]|nr:wax ester/triacylglycerol synthase domain-containing protein [Terriglobales bacterium]
MSRSMPSSSEIVPLSAIDESGNTVEPLSAQDQLFLMCEKPTTAMHVGILLVLEKGLPERRGGVDIDRLRQHVSARLESLPRYRKRIAYTPLRKIPVWVEDNFDIAFHVRHVALPTPRTDTALKVLCGELLAQPLHPAKPLWELHIIEGLRGGRTGVLAKAHHCLVDGVRGAHVLEVLLDIVQHAAEEEAEARRLRAVPRRRPRPALATEPRDLNRELLRWEAGEIWSSLAGVAGAVREMVRQPRQTLLRAVDAAADLSEVLRAGSAPAAASAINGSNSAGRRFDWLEMELDQIKAIKNRLGGTVNDVVLAIVTGGLRRFLIEQRGVRWPKDLRALVPVNRRSAGEGLTCGNFIAGMMVDLPISAVDPMWRYRVVCNRAAAAKHSRQA